MKRWIYIFFGLSLVIIIFLLGFFFLGPILFSGKSIEIPRLVGCEYNDALAKVDNLGIKYEIVYLEGKDGIVMDTSPQEGFKIKQNTIIKIYVGREDVYLQDYVGTYLKEARPLIIENVSKYENRIIEIEVINNDLPLGYITEQIPKANSLIDEASVIVIYYVIHDNLVEIPDFRGWNVLMIKEFEKDNELKFVYIYENSFVVDEDFCINQSAIPGSSIMKNGKTIVRIVISKGIEELPDFSGVDIGVAVSFFEYLELPYTIIYVDSNEKNNTVLECNYEFGYQIYVSK